MKKLTLLMTVIMLVTLLPVSVFADDGNAYSYYTDFEAYNASEVGPDASWGSGYQISANANKKKFSAYSDKGNKTMKLELGSEPILWLGQLMNKGKIHTSGYVKVNGLNSRMSLMSYDGRNADNASLDTYLNKYSKYIQVNDDGTVQYYLDPIAWKLSEPLKVADAGEWIKLDVIMTELSDETVLADYYANGVKLNPESVNVSESLGLRGVFYRFERQEDLTAAAGSYGLIDNISFERFFGTKNLEVKASEKIIQAENGSFEVMLSDSVDETLLTKENVFIKNTATGQSVEEFEVLDATPTGFSVTITEVLEKGQRFSLELSPEITGKMFGTSMAKAIYFMSENRVVDLGGKIPEISFDDYAPNDGELPEGFMNLEGADFVSSVVDGISGDEGDKAWGFVDAVKSSSNTRFMYEFENILPSGSECEISFDVYSSNIFWYFYLAENGDFDVETNGYDENLAISSERNGVLRYASSRSNRSSATIDNSLKTNQGGWSKVLLKVVPAEDGVEYKVSVDEGDEYTVSVDRDFPGGIAGFGFGYVATKATSEFRIDNIKIGYNAIVECPEVCDIALVDIYGKTVEGDNVTSMISGAYIDFSAFVDEESAIGHTALLKEGDECDFEYRMENLESGSRLNLIFPELLEADSSYTLAVAEGVEAGLSEDVISALSMEISFLTENDGAVRIFESKISEDSTEYELSIAKNLDEKVSCYAISYVYEEVIRQVDGVDTVFKKFKNAEYLPIVLETWERGIFEFEMPVAEEGAEVKLMLWPELKEIATDVHGNIIFK